MGGQKHLVYVPQEKQDDAKAFHLEVRLIQYNAIGCKSNNLSYQMTAQTGVATSWRITQHRALFRAFVHDNVRKFIGKIIIHQQHAHSSAFLTL